MSRSVFQRDAQNFLNRRHAAQHLVAAVFADPGTGVTNVTRQFLLRCAIVNPLAQRVVDDDQFIDADSTAKTTVTAQLAPRGAVDRSVRARNRYRGTDIRNCRPERCSRQSGHSTRTSRCASIPTMLVASRNGSTPISTSRVIAPTAVLVCKRRHDQVSGEARLHGNFGSFEVANLADHDDIRILAQDRAQTTRERHIRLVVHLRLTDPGQVVFDRILHREDVDRGAFEFGEAGIQASSFYQNP